MKGQLFMSIGYMLISNYFLLVHLKVRAKGKDVLGCIRIPAMVRNISKKPPPGSVPQGK